MSKSGKSMRRLAMWLFVIGAAGLIIGVGLGLIFEGKSFVSELSRAALTLGAGLIGGGAVKLLLDDYRQAQKQQVEAQQEAQKKEVEQHDLRERLLADLRDVYNRAEQARLMIQAHRSAKVYGEQMQVLIACQAVLLKFKRSLELRPETTGHVDPEDTYLPQMIGYLRALSDEYAAQYEDVEKCQQYEQEYRRRRICAFVAADTPFDSIKDEISSHTWDFLRQKQKFPVLNDMTKCDKQYTEKFVVPLHTLAARLLMTPSHCNDARYTAFEELVTANARKIQQGLQHTSIESRPEQSPAFDRAE